MFASLQSLSSYNVRSELAVELADLVEDQWYMKAAAVVEGQTSAALYCSLMDVALQQLSCSSIVLFANMAASMNVESVVHSSLVLVPSNLVLP
jgi:hypothetical protein